MDSSKVKEIKDNSHQVSWVKSNQLNANKFNPVKSNQFDLSRRAFALLGEACVAA